MTCMISSIPDETLTRRRFARGLCASFAIVASGCTTAGGAGEKLSIEVSTDRASPRYSPGESLQLFIRPSLSSQVVVLSINAVGQVTVLRPNSFSSETFMRGGISHAFPAPHAPFRLRVTDPLGANRIRVIATTGTRPLFVSGMVLPGSGGFGRFAGGATGLDRHVSVVMNAEPGLWAYKDYLFEVTR